MVKYTPWTRDAFKRGAKVSYAKIKDGAHPMIPSYYRRKYGKIKK